MSSPQQNTTLICPRCGRPTTGVNPCVCGETEVRLPSISLVLGSSYLPIRHREHAHSDVPEGPSFATPAPPRQPSPPHQQGPADYQHWSSHNPRQLRYDSSPTRHHPQYRERSASPARELSEARRSPLTRRSRPAFAPSARPPAIPPVLEAQAASGPRPAPAFAATEPEPWGPRPTGRGTRDPPPPPPPRRTLGADEAPPARARTRAPLPPAWAPRPGEEGPPVAGGIRASPSALTAELERQRREQRDRDFIDRFAMRVEAEHRAELGFRKESTKTACHSCVTKQRVCTIHEGHKNCCDQCWKDKIECTWPSDARPRSRWPGPGDGPGGGGDSSSDEDGGGPGPATRGGRGRGRGRGRPRGRGRGRGRATAAAA
ncbi:hypothetical protein V8F33_012520 [Rhypophila sp. PSN 637]